MKHLASIFHCTNNTRTTFPFSTQRLFSIPWMLSLLVLLVLGVCTFKSLYESCQYLLEKLLHPNHLFVSTCPTPKSVALFHFFAHQCTLYYRIWKYLIQSKCTWLTISFPMIIHLELELTHLNQTRSNWLSSHIKSVAMRCLHHTCTHKHTHIIHILIRLEKYLAKMSHDSIYI